MHIKDSTLIKTGGGLLGASLGNLAFNGNPLGIAGSALLGYEASKGFARKVDSLEGGMIPSRENHSTFDFIPQQEIKISGNSLFAVQFEKANYNKLKNKINCDKYFFGSSPSPKLTSAELSDITTFVRHIDEGFKFIKKGNVVEKISDESKLYITKDVLIIEWTQQNASGTVNSVMNGNILKDDLVYNYLRLKGYLFSSASN